MWDRISNRIAWILPPRIVYHAAIRLMAHATVGKYGDTIVSELGGMEAIGRWARDSGMDGHGQPDDDGPSKWNPFNKVVQDHRDGSVDDLATDRERARRGLPIPWTSELAGVEVHQPPVY